MLSSLKGFDMVLFDLKILICLLFSLEKLCKVSVWVGNNSIATIWFRKILYNLCLI